VVLLLLVFARRQAVSGLRTKGLRAGQGGAQAEGVECSCCSIFARGWAAPGSKASGLYTRVGYDAIEVSEVLVLLVFERGQVAPGLTVSGLDGWGRAQRKRGDEAYC